MKNAKVTFIVRTAMLAAISSVLYFIEFPLLPGAPFLKFDFSDFPALIGAFYMGPWCGLAVEIVKNLIHLLRTSTGGIGELANFIVGVCLIMPAAFIYKVRKNRSFAIVGLLVGIVLMSIGAAFANAFILLPWFGMKPEGGMMKFLFSTIIPFNLIKGAILSVLAIAFYKDFSRFLSGKKRT